MKKFVLLLITCLFAVAAFSQRVHFKNVYTTIDTLVIKRVQTIYPTKDGDYLINLPQEENLIIAYNSDHSKAIVLHGYMWGKKMEFNIKYDEARQVLWYKDEHIYCGYIYDTRYKICQYFEAINDAEKERLVKRFKFLERMPTFTEIKKGED